MQFTLDNEKRNTLRLAISKNHRPALRLQFHVKVIHQVIKEFTRLKSKKILPAEIIDPLIKKKKTEIKILYSVFPWGSLKNHI